MTAAEIFDYAERNNLFLSDHGVCAGPRGMIEEMLRALVDGHVNQPDTVLDADVSAQLDDVDAALDYGFLALQAHAAVSALWPIMVRAYEHIGDILAAWPFPATPTLDRLRERIGARVELFVQQSVFGTEDLRVSREHVLADMYLQSARGYGDSNIVPLKEAIAPISSEQTAEVREGLRARLHPLLCPDSEHEAALEAFTSILLDYLQREQGIVRAATAVQSRINPRLGRAPAVKPFRAADINLYFLMQDGPRRIPYLMDDLREVLGLAIAVTGERIEFATPAPHYAG